MSYDELIEKIKREGAKVKCNSFEQRQEVLWILKDLGFNVQKELLEGKYNDALIVGKSGGLIVGWYVNSGDISYDEFIDVIKEENDSPEDDESLSVAFSTVLFNF